MTCTVRTTAVSDRLSETLLPKRIALPIFSSDALSSVAYATEEILLVLGIAGTAYYHVTPTTAISRTSKPVISSRGCGSTQRSA